MMVWRTFFFGLGRLIKKIIGVHSTSIRIFVVVLSQLVQKNKLSMIND